jgi:DNA-binding winged helix-turn-helix (wHTH) protein/TolB-like protein/Tfp pilus assembly protein PilF
MADRLLLNERMLDIERAELCDPSGHVVVLRPQALAVLLELARRKGEVVTKRDLLAHVWPGLVVTADSLVQCVVDIRHALGDTGQRIVRTVPRRGYMLIADAAHDADAPVASAPAARRRYRAAAAALGLVTAIGLSAWLLDSEFDTVRRRVASHREEAVLAVLPLRELNVATQAPAPDGEGFAYMIAGELARNPDLHVVSTLVASELRAKGRSARQIGATTGARYVVDGSVERRGNRLGLQVQLIDTENDRIAWSGRFEPTADELPGVTRLLLEQISGSLGSTVRELRISASSSRAPASLDVHALALHGIAVWQRPQSAERLRQAREELERATRLDPGYAPAWVYLGVVKTLLIASGNDPELGPPDHPQAIAEIRRAIELDPSLANSWRMLSFAIDSGQQPEEAVQAAERAVELGPGDPDNWLALGLAQYHARRLDAALRNFEKAISWNRGLRPAVYATVEARLRYALQDYAQALPSARDCMERAPALAVCKAIWLSAQMRSGHAPEAESAWPRLVAATPRLQTYRYAPRGTPEASAIDEDLDRLRDQPRAAMR